MSTTWDAIVVGGGIYGLTAALELRARGRRVALLDPGPLPHPLASSTDISKVVRMEYGVDAEYMALTEEAIEGWRRWNAEFDEPLYHEVGLAMLTRRPMAPGGFEHDSYQTLLSRGHRPERLGADEITRRFPAWKPGNWIDGFFHAVGGFAESGRVVAALARRAEQEGVDLRQGEEVVALLDEGRRVVGVRTRQGVAYHAADVLVATGAWTPRLVPELAAVLRAVGQPVFHLRPTTAARPDFEPPHLPVFTADVARTGWYGFPLHPREGVVKIANHGPGRVVDPATDPRDVTPADETSLRDFLPDLFPNLAAAPIVGTRLCLYCDTPDEHFWITRHPERPGLTISTGGSGHGFKMAPMLGRLAADAVEGKTDAWLEKFRWRELGRDVRGEEAARFHGEDEQ